MKETKEDKRYTPMPYMECQKDGTMQQKECDVIEEYHVKVLVNDTVLYYVVCSPCDLDVLVLGRLYTDQIITSADQIASMEVSYEEHCVNVHLKEQVNFSQDRQKTAFVTSCDSSTNYDRLMENSKRSRKQAFQWKKEWIFKLAAEFNSETPLYRHIQGLHSCFLSVNGETKYVFQDIGRHNALDKIIGKALKENIDFTNTILFISGRVPIDMFRKVIICGIPLIASNTVPTVQAVELARKYQVVLIGKAKTEHFQLYHDIV